MRRRGDRVWLALALLPLAWLFYRNTMLVSREIDGVRYFLLDDDMMISMRYGRNLAEGNGLVWNPGERVEGYTNFLWVLVMAAVHLLPVAASKIALVVKAINFALTASTLALSLRLLRQFTSSRLAAPLLLMLLVTCADVLLWSVWGFEVALLTFLNTLFLVRIAEGKDDVWTFVALALLPLTRGDGLYVFGANALIAFLVADDPARIVRRAAIALVPAIVHFAFRRAYYGEWLPNTFYLKMYGLDEPMKRGSLYARNFIVTYAVVLVGAGASAVAILQRERRGVIFFGTVLPTIFWITWVGGDMFVWFRFVGHVMPVVFVFAASGVSRLVRGIVGELAWAAVLLLVSIPLRPVEKLVFLDTNGDPLEQIQVAILVKKNARPESSIAVIPAGIVPYFTGLRAIDVLGKSDRHVAHLKPVPGAMVGHGKLDPAYTLGLHPDLVISCRSHAFAAALSPGLRSSGDPVGTFLASAPFKAEYFPFPIHEPFLLGRSAIYTHEGSPELKNPDWKGVTVLP